ncbi:MAG TPA: response regulator [Roseiarcus sp.]|nr:response regulator [Roseiarcus sp.]
MGSSALRDRRILVVEDEYLIAVTLSDQLEGVGSIVIGPVPSVERAMKAIESDPDIDAAILDINLGGVMAYPIADALLARNIPFVFTSGYDDDILRSRYPQVRSCLKPYLFPEMEKALAKALLR